jgi:Lysozyme inhibitor LprI
MDATEEMLQTTLYGREPTHQRNAKAELEAKLVLQELAEVVQEIAKISKTKRIFRVQRKWEAFKHAEAERQSAIWGRRARMGPLIYHYAVKRLAKERVRELREWLKNEGISVLGPA